ncbi:oxygenase MpaB family protein [Kitasatospora sp. NPDC052896]|uniref:oxygenase MpaB family protein n=1 Tax=Kitasatospora sp. NPDC052896 TaxID=3364061 RepID=UPI0037C956E0
MSQERTRTAEPPTATGLLDAGVNVFALAVAVANVIMQLARLPIAYGVIESKVEHGRIDRHPFKRMRTTLSYLVIALFGTDAERAVMRHEVNRSHRRVRSDADSPVDYTAFDRELQLWVAACLFWGLEDFHQRMHGPQPAEAREALYQAGARLGTTLQVTESMWPADRAAFEEYWNASLEGLSMDDTSRAFLHRLAGLAFLPAPLRLPLGSFHRFLTTGFLPPRFREELRLPWSDRRQRAFDAYVTTTARVSRALPRPVRQFPWNLILRDARRRIRQGRPIV